MKIVLADDNKSNEVDFQNGEYHRNFKRSEQPFDVTPEEWKALRRTKLFDLAKETPAPAPAEDQQSQQDGEQQQKAGSQKRTRTAAQN